MGKKHLSSKWLAVGIILLFVGTGIIPAIAQETEKSLQTSRGTWLYVGGSGPGNYTKIQDAIDNASEGDTVFVYSDSSPYYGNVIVNKSIHLIGEDQASTIIDGMYYTNTIWIPSSLVYVCNFTVINCRNDLFSAGIFVTEKLSWPLPDPPASSDVHIVNCIVKNNSCGIRFINTRNSEVASCDIHHNLGHSIYMNNGSYITIHDCYIHENGQVVPEGYYSGGVIISDQEWLEGSDNIFISHCKIINNVWSGITIDRGSININIESNVIKENTYFGIFIWDISSKKTLSNISISNNNVSYNGINLYGGGIGLQGCKKSVEITQNNIIDNHDGVYLLRSSFNSIFENNLIGNYRNAFFKSFCFLNHWDKNYWNDWQGLGPKLIKGKLSVIPWMNFDWHPAQEPYDAPGT
ncbi:MAG: hypothetical protein BV458_03265 [Thermoplasmata archaeon M9B2D]|nr:MAG: hypothetical protein BV458_03265 [Thermoplasmata archaeon M9B2D]